MTAAVAVAQFLILGFIDVPAHRIGCVLPAVLLLGIAVNYQRRHRQPENRAHQSQTFLLRGALAAIPAIAALCWISMKGNHKYAASLEDAAAWTLGSGSEDSSKDLDDTIAIAPLDWRGYFLRAHRALAAGPFPREAQRDFHRARILAPHAPSLPRQEAHAWIANGMNRHALPAWREQLQRDPTRASEHFGSMLETAKDDEELTRLLVLLAEHNPDLQLLALRRATKGAPFDNLVAETLVATPDLHQWRPEQLADLFEVWLQRGNHARLETILTDNKHYAATGWKTLFKLYAQSQRYAKAVELAGTKLRDATAEAIGPDEGTSSRRLPSLKAAFARSRGDLASGLQLARHEARNGRTEDALAVLEHLDRIHSTSSVPPVLLLKAWCHQKLHQFEKATHSYAAFLEADAHPTRPPNWIANKSGSNG